MAAAPAFTYRSTAEEVTAGIDLSGKVIVVTGESPRPAIMLFLFHSGRMQLNASSGTWALERRVAPPSQVPADFLSTLQVPTLE